MSDTESSDEEKYDKVPVIEDVIEDTESITTSIQSGKPKKQRTEKQIAALEKARATRKSNAAKKVKIEQDNNKLLEDNKEMLRKLATQNSNNEVKVKSKRQKKQPKIVYESDPSDEEEVIVVKKRPKKYPKKQKIVYESSSSDEEEDDLNNLTNPQNNQVQFHEEEYQYNYSNAPLKYSDVINYGY